MRGLPFVPTASGEPDHYVASFYAAFLKLGCRPSVLTFFKRTPDLRSFLLDQDVIYVGGGNTKSLLALWRDWGVAEILREAWQSGIVLTGVSAGAICWFEQGLTDSFSDGLRPLDCLGFLPGSCCPHYDGEAQRRPSYHRLLAAGKSPPVSPSKIGPACITSARRFIKSSLQARLARLQHARSIRFDPGSAVADGLSGIFGGELRNPPKPSSNLQLNLVR